MKKEFDPFYLIMTQPRVRAEMVLKNPVNVRNGTVYFRHEKIGRIVTGGSFPEKTYQLDPKTFNRYYAKTLRLIRTELKRKGYKDVHEVLTGEEW